MRTIFQHQKPIQKDLQLLSNRMNILKKSVKQIHNGKGRPSNKVGSDGHLYIDTTEGAKAIYLKENGEWL